MSKAGLIQMTRCNAMEFAPGGGRRHVDRLTPVAAVFRRRSDDLQGADDDSPVTALL
jgi:hypothetical protein